MSSTEAGTLHASSICSTTVHTAAVLKETRSFLTDITAHRLRLPCRRDAPTSCQIKIIRRDHAIQSTLHSIEAMLPAAPVVPMKGTGWLSDAGP